MFKPWQVILFLLVLVLGVVGFIFWYYTPGLGNTINTDTVQVATDTRATAPTVVDTSDASLDADLNAIDDQIKVVGSDSASIDESLNDKPVAQTE